MENCEPFPQPASCYLGLYCPHIDSNNKASKCIPSLNCAISRLLSKDCKNINNSFGAQGRYEPVVCRKGFYCPDTKTIFSCPKGYFCPSGTVKPRQCDYFSICSAGSTFQQSFTGIVAATLLDFLLLTLWYVQWQKEKRLKRMHNYSRDGIITSADAIKPLEAQDKLYDNFYQSTNGQKNFNLDIQELNYSLKSSGKIILENISVTIREGKFLGVIGPSGCGKSTLLDILRGKLRKSSGKLFVSGRKADLAEYKHVYGFVPQEDVILPELTVRDNILHSARMRLSISWSPSEIEAHVDNILASLKLSDIAHSLIQDISGGQKKKVNIGIEIVAAPLYLLILDEPTTGLDSTSALEVSQILSNISNLGVTVTAVLHQPRVEIFNMLDDVLMMVEGGRVAYFGSAKSAKPYFEGIGFEFPTCLNEADIIMDILSGRGNLKTKKAKYNLDYLVESWRSKYDFRSEQSLAEADSEFNSQRQLHKGAPFLRQLWYCTKLSLLQQYRKPAGFILEISIALVAGLLIGFSVNGIDELYIGILKAPFSILSLAPVHAVVPQLSLLVGMAIALSAAPSATSVFSEERKVYQRNMASGHSPIAYFVGKSFSVIPRIGVISLHFSAITYCLAAPVIPYWVDFNLTFLQYFGVYGIGSFISMTASHSNATLVAVVLSLFSGALSGYGPTYAEAKHLHVHWIWLLSFNMYAAQARFSETLFAYDHVWDSQYAADIYGYALNVINFDFIMMLVIGIAWRILAFYSMLVRDA